MRIAVVGSGISGMVTSEKNSNQKTSSNNLLIGTSWKSEVRNKNNI
jgi:hypothetical protein